MYSFDGTENVVMLGVEFYLFVFWLGLSCSDWVL